MKKLLTATALIESGAGVGLLAVPSVISRLLLGVTLDTPATLTVARIAGVALLALGIACWLVSYDARTCAARGVVSAMGLYNLGAVIVLGAAGLQMQPVGIGLWPAVILHIAMTAWCLVGLLKKT